MIQTLLTMKSLFLTIACVLAFLLSAHTQSCLPDGITFTTQGQIDSFPINYPGCKVIEGDVVISSQNITGLDSLYLLTRVNGYLEISATALVNFAGLDSLRSVGFGMTILSNSNLSSFEGLASLEAIDGNILRIESNHSLESLDGLSGPLQLYGLSISQNSELDEVNDLDHTIVQNSVNIYYNQTLDSLPSFVGLGKLSSVSISGNPKLENLGAFIGVEEVEWLSLFNNGTQNSSNGIIDLSAFNEVKSIYRLVLFGNNLKSTHGMENVTSLSEFSLSDQVIDSVVGFDNVKQLSGELFLKCPNLNSLNMFPSLEFIGGNLRLFQLNKIDTIKLFTNLKTLGGGLEINSCASLLDVSEFMNIEQVGMGSFKFSFNPLINSLKGMEFMDSIYAEFEIIENDQLVDISSFKPGSFLGPWFNFEISDNSLLNLCSVNSICDFLSNVEDYEDVVIEENGVGCSSITEVLLGCGVKVLFLDSKLLPNEDCMGISVAPASSIKYIIESSNWKKIVSSNLEGRVIIPIFTSDPFVVHQDVQNLKYWQSCKESVQIDPIDFIDSIITEMNLKPVDKCPRILLDLSLPSFFRSCLVESQPSISIQNVGTIPAENSIASVILPMDALDVVLSTPSPSWANGDTLFYSLGDLGIFEHSDIDLVVKTKCDTFLLGQTLCVEAFATFDNPCDPDPPIGSIVTIHPECIGDTLVEFTLSNIGDAPTMNDHDYFIIEDEVILKMAPFTLNPMQQMTVQAQADGSTFRMEATKLDNGTLTAAAIEGCGGLNPGLINAYWVDQGEAAYDKDCREVRLAYDPNEKSAVPTGVGPEHLMVANRPIQYTIDFQNTGTDTAYRVLIRDVLPAQLDVTSFRPLFATHDYTWQIYGNDTLEFLFQPIALPDSAANQEGSKGFVTFTIDQLPDLPNGTIIENSADIVFDFNPPIYTNTVTHTIGKLLVRITTPIAGMATWAVWGNPVGETALFKAHQDIIGTNQFELTDLSGRIIRSTAFQGNEFVFHRQGLAGGMYFFTITDERGGVCAGRIVVAE